MLMSNVLSPMIIPVRPPVMKVDTIPIENSIAGFICKFPFQMVVIQLNDFTADGMAINKVVKVNTDPKNGFIPDMNIWWPHTMVDRNAIAKREAIMARYPKIGLRALVAKTSETIPMAGRITIYTSGCPKNQNKCSNRTGDPPWWCKTSPWMNISDKKKEVPKLLSIMRSRTAANSTGKETTPTMAVIRKAQMVKGNRVMDMPFVLRLITVTIKSVSYTHLRAHETDSYLVCRLLLEKKKKKT